MLFVGYLEELLQGEGGNDVIDGGGIDFVLGGTGRNTLSGDDTFVFSASNLGKHDVITNSHPGVDQLESRLP